MHPTYWRLRPRCGGRNRLVVAPCAPNSLLRGLPLCGVVQRLSHHKWSRKRVARRRADSVRVPAEHRRDQTGARSARLRSSSQSSVCERERRERGRERSSRRRTRRRGIIPTPSARSFLRSPLRANTSALCKLTCASRLTCVTRPVHLRDNPRVTHASLFVLVYHCVVPR